MATTSEVFELILQLNVTGDRFDIASSIQSITYDNDTYLFNSSRENSTNIYLKIKDKPYKGIGEILFEDNTIKDGIYEVICIFAPKKGKAIVGTSQSTPGDLVHVDDELHVISGEETDSVPVDLDNLESFLENSFYNKLQVFVIKVAIIPCSYDRYKKELKSVSERLLAGDNIKLIKEEESCGCDCNCTISELPSRIGAYKILLNESFLIKNEDLAQTFNIFTYDECCSCCEEDKKSESDEECEECKDCKDKSYIYDAQKDADIVLFDIPDSQSLGSYKGISNILSVKIKAITITGSMDIPLYDTDDYQDIINPDTGLFNKDKFIKSLSDLLNPDDHGYIISKIYGSKTITIQRNQYDTTYGLYKLVFSFYIRKGVDFEKYSHLFENKLISITKTTERFYLPGDEFYDRVDVSYEAWNDEVNFNYVLEEEGGDVQIGGEIVYVDDEQLHTSKFGTWVGETNAKVYKILDYNGNILAVKKILKQ